LRVLVARRSCSGLGTVGGRIARIRRGRLQDCTSSGHIGGGASQG